MRHWTGEFGKRRVLRVAAAACLLAMPVPARATAASFDPSSAERAGSYLAQRQRADGSVPGYGDGAATIGEVVVALVAGHAPADSIARAMMTIRTAGPSQATRATYAGRLVLGIVAAGENPHTYGGFDYVAKLRSYYNPATGLYDGATLYGNALASLGVLAAGETLPAQAVRAWKSHQCRDGGWAVERNCAGRVDIDTSALALSVLVAAKVPASDSTRSNARSFLISAENTRGGYGQGPGEETNGNSTGLALSAIAALREDPAAAPWSRGPGKHPIAALTALQTSSGGIKYVSSDADANDYATVQAVPGLAGDSYPVRGTAGSPNSPKASSSPKAGARPGSSIPASPSSTPSVLGLNVTPAPSTDVRSGDAVRPRALARSDDAPRRRPIAVVAFAIAALVGSGFSLAFVLRSRARGGLGRRA